MFFKSSKSVECFLAVTDSDTSSTSSFASSTSIAPRLGSRTATMTSKTAITPRPGVNFREKRKVLTCNRYFH